MARTKDDIEKIIGVLGSLIKMFESNPLLAGWLLEKQIELKREIMDGAEYRK